MKNKKTFLLSAAIIAALLPLSACGKKEDAHNKSQNETAKTADFDINSKFTIALSNFSDIKPIGGFYTSDDETQARARIGGTLVSLNVDEGSMVSQGQVIGVIQEARYSAEVAAGIANAGAAGAQAQAAQSSAGQAPANLQAAQAMANKAAADYQRTKQLYDQGVYAKARLDQMEASMIAAQAQVNAASAGLSAANANAMAAKSQATAASAQAKVAEAVRAQGKIIAPRSGKVTMVPVAQGSVIMPGEIVAFIAAGSNVLRLNAPERDAKKLQVGQSVTLTDDSGNAIGTTTISKIYPMVQNGQVKIDLAPDGREHLVGERANVLIPLGNRDAIIIPRNYIITRQGVDFVKLLKGNQALEVPIQRGQAASNGAIKDGVEILSGLQISDVIVAPLAQGK